LKKSYIFLGIIVVLILLLLIPVGMFISYSNSIKAMNNEIESQMKQVDNILLRRHDLIPNLVNAVKGYMAHEKEIFTNLNNARNRMLEANTVREKAAANGALESALNRLMMVVENYPQLRANEQVNRLMDNLEGTENRLAVERKRYNDLVKVYNNKVELFPGSIFAGLVGATKKDYFEIPETARENPIVDFNS
jgi:LemA protein